jgi:hypothetical protein
MARPLVYEGALSNGFAGTLEGVFEVVPWNHSPGTRCVFAARLYEIVKKSQRPVLHPSVALGLFCVHICATLSIQGVAPPEYNERRHTMDMQKFLVDLSKCSADDLEKYKRVLDLGFDSYIIPGRPHCYEVMWDNPEPLTDFIPVELVHPL